MHRDEFMAQLRKDDIQYTRYQIDKAEAYMKYILKMNESINLTAIKDEDSFWELMIYDSLIPLKYCSMKNMKVLDVGTGAGFPGAILSIFVKGYFTLLDSTAKKINVINGFKSLHATAVADRCENYVKEHREDFDMVTARAVAPLNILAELALPFVKVDGYFIAYKAKNAEKELEEAESAIKKLGGEVELITDDMLSNGEERHIIFIKKKKETNKKYPRDYSVITDKPL